MDTPITTTQQRFTCRQLGTLAGAFDYRIAETARKALLPGLDGASYQQAARAYKEAV